MRMGTGAGKMGIGMGTGMGTGTGAPGASISGAPGEGRTRWWRCHRCPPRCHHPPGSPGSGGGSRDEPPQPWGWWGAAGTAPVLASHPPSTALLCQVTPWKRPGDNRAASPERGGPRGAVTLLSQRHEQGGTGWHGRGDTEDAEPGARKPPNTFLGGFLRKAELGEGVRPSGHPQGRGGSGGGRGRCCWYRLCCGSGRGGFLGSRAELDTTFR